MTTNTNSPRDPNWDSARDAAWAHYFGTIGTIGSGTLRQFVAGCDGYYLADKLAGSRATKREEAHRLRNCSTAVIAAPKGGAV